MNLIRIRTDILEFSNTIDIPWLIASLSQLPLPLVVTKPRPLPSYLAQDLCGLELAQGPVNKFQGRFDPFFRATQKEVVN